MLEVGQGHQRTGRTISIPNSMLMTEPVLNESLAGEYMLHLMTIPVDRSDDLAAIERKALHGRAGSVRGIHRRRSPADGSTLSPPWADPSDRRPPSHVPVVDKNTVNILLRIPTPSRLERQVEQRVLRAVLDVPKGRDTLRPPRLRWR